MIKTNEEVKERIRKRIQEIDRYLLSHHLLFNPVVEDLLRERTILSKKLMLL